MSMNPVPKLDPNIPVEKRTWNEHFYYCLQKPFWIIAAGILCIGLLIWMIIFGYMTDLLSLFVAILLSFGIIYVPIGLPASIIYATVMRMKFARKSE